MVHQTRTPSKAIPAKHLSPMRSSDDMMAGKYAISSSPADSFLRTSSNASNNSRLTVNMAAAAAAASSQHNMAYKYNNMVNNNREQFNALHFC